MNSVILVSILGNVIVSATPGRLPDFFDESDLKSLGLKKHSWDKLYSGPPVTESTAVRSESFYHYNPYANEQQLHRPKYGLPPHRVPIKPIQRGDPRNENIVQRVEDALDEQVFPNNIGEPSHYDFDDLDMLPQRLTDTHKWGEFRQLIAEEEQQMKGKVMKNWEEDAHKWAGYSKHLLERAEHEVKKKEAARQRNIQRQAALAATLKPSLGLEMYWGDQTVSPMAAVAAPMWTRRSSYDEPSYDDDRTGPLDHSRGMPPMYYKQYQANGGPMVRLDNSYLLPGQKIKDVAELDYPQTLKEGELLKYLPPYPDTGPLSIERGRPSVFRNGIPQGLLTHTNPRNNPDYYPGSVPKPGDKLHHLDQMTFDERDIPEELKNNPLAMNSGYLLGDNYAMRTVQRPGPPRGNNPKKFGQGQGPSENYSPAKPLSPNIGYPQSDSNNPALRMGPIDTSGPRIPGPGSEADFPDGYRMAGNYPGGGMQGGYPPGGMQGGPPPGGFQRNPQFMQGPPEELYSDLNENSQDSKFPNYGGPPRGQRGPPPGPGGPPVRHRGPPGGYGGNKQWGPQATSNNAAQAHAYLLKVAQQKLAALDKENKQAQNMTLRMRSTTTFRPPTKEEMLKNLPQFDDFHAPVSWVKFNSPEIRDGLARVTDPKTHQNQQYFIQGEMYVPIIDESMARLGWTTESPIPITTVDPAILNEAAIKVVMRSLNLNATTQHDWLVFETILGSSKVYGKECEEEGCQSRCQQTGCDTLCIGSNCNAFCKAPGCKAMCEGMTCEARCWGKDCDAQCSNFSCQKAVNGVHRAFKGNWDQMYPQYGMGGNPDEAMQSPQGGPVRGPQVRSHKIDPPDNDEGGTNAYDYE